MYFLMLPFLVHKIFTFYINGVLNCKSLKRRYVSTTIFIYYQEVSNRQHVSTHQGVIIRSITKRYRIVESCAHIWDPISVYKQTYWWCYTYGIPLVFINRHIGGALAPPICLFVNTSGIPYVCAALYDSVSLCDGPDGSKHVVYLILLDNK